MLFNPVIAKLKFTGVVLLTNNRNPEKCAELLSQEL